MPTRPRRKEAEAKKEAEKKEAEEKKQAAEREKKRKQLKDKREPIERAIAAIDATLAAQANDYNKALELFDKSGDWDPLLKAEWLAGAGKREEANQLLEREMKQDPNEVLPLATWIHINASLSSLDTLRGKFDQLRTLASTADLNTPLLARLNKVAQSFGLPNDWRSPEPARVDIGARPALDTLGPIHWQPYTAPSFELTRNDGQPLNSSSLQGKPTVLIFYLGSGCLHCVKQLQKFNEQREEFEKAGIQLLAISTEDLTQLQEGIRNYEKPISIPLLADPQQQVFKAYRCQDDFEKQPLHGTFIIDPAGRVRWQDISFEPFDDVSFVLKETERLLKIK